MFQRLTDEFGGVVLKDLALLKYFMSMQAVLSGSSAYGFKWTEYVSPVTNSLIAKLHEAVWHIHTVSPFLEDDDVFFKIQEVEMHFRIIFSDVSLAGRLNALAAHMKVEHVANNKSCLVDWVRKEIKTLNLLSRDIFVLACCAQIDTTASQQHIKVAFTAVAQDTCLHYNNAGIPTDKFPLWCNTLWQLFQRHAETRAA